MITSKTSTRNVKVIGTFHLIPSKAILAKDGINAYVMVINNTQAFTIYNTCPEPERRFERTPIEIAHDASWSVQNGRIQVNILVGGRYGLGFFYLPMEDTDRLFTLQ